ncbi:MAG TPA: PadR family transcriptional regulator [Candidatus Angelobacter sp.]|jgi:DNA-binding PadR family transcriptional regulator|nr:PadR family transcriptional regulator [Candidatus Angelobacter sp.]
MPELNATAASLLGFLQSGPRSGWEVVQAVEATIGNFWNVTRSQVYRELRSLEEQGLVEAGETGARDRRPYAATDSGRRAFAEWISREPGPDLVRSPLLLTVFFGQYLDPALLRRFLVLHRARHEKQLDEYEHLYEGLAGLDGEEYSVLALRYGIEHERAVLRWMESLPLLNDAAATAPGRPGRGGS